MPDDSSAPTIDDLSPVTPITAHRSEPGPADGIALCLSGGGYRAMLFHLGALLRLNEAGLLRRINLISSVSGGSITSAVLGLNWAALSFDGNGVAGNLTDLVVNPVRNLASQTVDERSIVFGLFLKGSISKRVAGAYDKHLFHGATLQDLPDGESGPTLLINSTNVQSGNLWRFSRPYMGDYQVGQSASSPGEE